MGNNTVALFLNDCAGDLDRDGEATLRTLRECLRSGQGTDRYGGPGQMQVLPSVHADGQQIIAAGGNRITLLGIAHGLSHEPEDILRQLASHYGFTLTKKRSARPTTPISHHQEKEPG